MDRTALREEFSKAQKEAQDVVSLASKESRDLSAEEKAANDKRFARMDSIKKLFDEDRRFAELKLNEGTAVTPTEPAGKKEFDNAEGQEKFTDANGAFNLLAYKKALNHFACTGDMRQLFTVTSGTQSGAYLPKEVLQPVSVRRLQNSWRACVAAGGYEPMNVPTSASFSLPVADDTANVGQAVSESATSGTALDPTQTGAISISPTVYDSKALWYSNTMMNAGTFDVVQFSLPILQKRIDKIQESAWTTTAIALTPGKTLAATTAITYIELLAWEHSLAAAYRTDACFVVSDSLYQALRGLVDDQHRPIFDQDPTNVFAGKIHGKPVIINDYFQTFIANKVVGAFVSSDAVKIVDVSDARLARYTNIPSQPDQTGFQMFQNGDAGFVTSGISTLKTAIS